MLLDVKANASMRMRTASAGSVSLALASSTTRASRRLARFTMKWWAVMSFLPVGLGSVRRVGRPRYHARDTWRLETMKSRLQRQGRRERKAARLQGRPGRGRGASQTLHARHPSDQLAVQVQAPFGAAGVRTELQHGRHGPCRTC